MSKSDPTPVTAFAEEDTFCPWDPLEPDGAGLSVHDFLTTLFSHTSNGLSRAITVPYANQFGLSVSEWRILSVLAHAGSLPFPELVKESAADKGQVSRTLAALTQRELTTVEVPPAGRKGMLCHVTEKGRDLYKQVMPVAQRSQAAMILKLPPDARRTLYAVLKTLRSECGEMDGS